MKKNIIFTCTFVLPLLFSNNMQAQTTPDSIEVNKSSCFKVFINDTPAKEKMSIEKSWISQNFGNYKSVLQYEDEVKNTIVIKGFLELYASQAEQNIKKLQKMIGKVTDKRQMHFTIEFSNKDDRYRIRISDITIKTSSVTFGGMRGQYTYEEWTDQGVTKAREKLIEIQTELDSLKSVNTNGMKSSEIKNLNKKISEAEEEVKESKEKLDKKIQKSNIEKRWLNSNLSAIYNGINNYLKNNPDDDF